ncbi:MFS transporter [Virgisporangium aurantiacum]|uniref:MFS transporter n=1 Tax=Virgisporangium aurantiacum TaxID=175570 RepID=A0A8J3Z2Z1_9ACTN|nr:MFS transporter [Virgisporangium aurantiacum]GIJ54345.1 MFS transporter [Virgisporangium aurantiacum]
MSDAADPRRWRALMVSQIAAFMSLLDVSIVNVALPSIERDLGASAATAQWVVSGYALAFGLVLVAAGRLGDAFGRRRMFLVALSAFVLTSVLSGAAPSIGLLIGARLLQGVAGGLLIPQNSGLIQDLFRGAERGRAFGIMGATVGLSTATGPVVGGLILSAFTGPDGWRWIFYVNIPIGLVGLVLAARLLPRTAARRDAHRTHLDLVGSLLLGGGVLALLLPVVHGETGSLGGWWPLFAVAVAMLFAFVRWEARTIRRGRQPLIDPQLAHTPGYATGSGIGLLYFVGFTGIWLVLALFFQDGLGYPPLHSGLAVTPFALGAAASAAVAGRLVSRVGRWLTVYGLTAVIVGLLATALALAHVGGTAAAWAAAVPLLLAGVGGGMVTSPNLTLSLQNVPVRMAGVAGGALQTAQRIGAAVGTAVLATIFYRILATTGHRYPDAISRTLLCAAGFMALALLVALADALRQPSGAESRAAVTG